MPAESKKYKISCRCGEVQMVAIGAPIVAATCHCNSCQQAAASFAALPGAPRVLNAEAGTEFELYRKDRVSGIPVEGLRAHKLTPASSTRRLLARCCDSPMFLEFKGGHWLSIYRDRFVGDAPPIEMRVMTRYRPGGVALSGPVPIFKRHSISFMWRLLAAWVAMGFRAPDLQPIAEG
jgi:hypothetical protein